MKRCGDCGRFVGAGECPVHGAPPCDCGGETFRNGFCTSCGRNVDGGDDFCCAPKAANTVDGEHAPDCVNRKKAKP